MPAWNSTEYARRLAAQGRDELVQVVAWHADGPVGKAMVLFPGYDEYSVSAEREVCGEIRDVEVEPHVRRIGVATPSSATRSRTGRSSRARTSSTTTGSRSRSGPSWRS
jgi:hypothetical protein